MTDDLGNFWDKQCMLKVVLPSVQAVVEILFEFQENSKDWKVICLSSSSNTYFKNSSVCSFPLCQIRKVLSYV